MTNTMYSWKFLKDWSLLSLLNEIEKNSETTQLPVWNSFESFYNNYKSFSEKEKKYYLELLVHSDDMLVEFGGDPLNHSWFDFRPLRLSREEDWSDWLTFFLYESNSCFIFNLFDRKIKAKKVHREFVASSFRADIVIEWDDNISGTIIEVKTGDQNLSKTYATNLAITKSMTHIKKWNNYILLLDNQSEDWQPINDLHQEDDDRIKPITWSDIAVAIRKCLFLKSEDLLWRSLAYTFAGCIETKLNNAVSIKRIKSNQSILSIYNQIEILERSLKDV